MPLRNCLLGCVCLAMLVGCAPAEPKLHYALGDPAKAKMPHKLILLPVDIVVSELTAAGTVEKDPQWTAAGLENVTRAVQAEGRGTTFEVLPFPALTDEERQVVEEHLALFNVVAGSARVYAGGLGGWDNKVKRFDYSLGPGLIFLADKTGAEGALVISGVDYINSPGRKTAFVLYAMMGVGISMGQCAMVGGVVDLRTGDLLWYDQIVDTTKSFRDPQDAQQLIRTLLQSNPSVGKNNP